MKTEKLLCPGCGHAETHQCDDGETYEGLKCPNCDEDMIVVEDDSDDE